MFRSAYRTLVTVAALSTLFVGCSNAITAPGDVSKAPVVMQTGSGAVLSDKAVDGSDYSRYPVAFPD
jgi:hypothetical protein